MAGKVIDAEFEFGWRFDGNFGGRFDGDEEGGSGKGDGA